MLNGPKRTPRGLWSGLKRLLGQRVRRVAVTGARAFIEVRMPPAAGYPAFARDMEAKLSGLHGVEWAQLNPYASRVVVAFDPDRCPLQTLQQGVEEVERSHRLEGSPFSLNVEEHPADSEPLLRNTAEMAFAAAGIAGAATVRALRFKPPRVYLDLREIVSVIKNTPRLRRAIEKQTGFARADVLLSIGSTLMHATSGSVAHSALTLAYRVAQRSELNAHLRVWQERMTELCSTTSDSKAPLIEPRPCPMPPGPIEQYAEGAWNVSLGGFVVGIADTQGLHEALTPLVNAVPKAANRGREMFATQLHRAIANRGVLCRQPRVLRRLDRLHTVIIDAQLLLRGTRTLAQLLPVDTTGLQELGHRASRLFDSENASAIQERDGWKLGPLDEVTADAEVPAGAQGHGALGLVRNARLVAVIQTVPALDPAAEDVLAAVRRAGLRFVLAADSPEEVASLDPDQVIRAGDALLPSIRQMQREGHGVALVAAGDSDALAASDCGIGICRKGRPVPWGAHLLCSSRIDEVPLILDAIEAARTVSKQSVNLSLTGSALGAFLTLEGLRGDSTRRVKPAVNAAATLAMINGFRSGLKLGRRSTVIARDPIDWHALTPEQALQKLGSRPSGLDPHEAERRVQERPVAKPDKPGLLRSIAREVDNPLTPVLGAGAGAVASAGIGSPGDAGIVGAAIALSAIISGVARFRAEKAIMSLEQDESREASVLRDDIPISISSDKLVVGDVLVLNQGEVIPADCRILEADNLEVDESNLTGESLPVSKSPEPSSARVVAERASMLYEGTSIATGHAKALVVATGEQVESKRGLRAIGIRPPPTGTDARLKAITRLTLPVALASGAVLMGSGLLRGRRIREVAPAGVSLAVASVPEGLPLLATAAQLAAAKRLSVRGALVRNPAAMEALGRVNVLCADKTGTLTEGKLRLDTLSDGRRRARVGEQQDETLRHVLAAGLRATPAAQDGQPLPHPTDQGVVESAQRAGVSPELGTSEWRRELEIPFKPATGYHATLGRTTNGRVLDVKGAPEVILPRCSSWLIDGQSRALDEGLREELQRQAAKLADDGLRVLVVADRQLELEGEPSDAHVNELRFTGFLGLADPIRPAAVDAIRRLGDAGARVIMITGDHPSTARSIGSELGLCKSDEACLTGPDIDGMTDSRLDRALTKASVIARATPSQKVRIVKALQRGGAVVAMTGDGANDAPAIRLADVGIALGERATSAARGAADMVVVDEKIETIVEAVVEGRAMWASVRDAVSILIGGNLGEIGFTLASGLLTTKPPLNARQLMLVNLLTDVAPSLAVAVQPPRQESSESLLRGGPAEALGDALTHDVLWRAVVTSTSGFVGWGLTQLWRKRQASTVGLLSVVGSQLGQTLALGGKDRSVAGASLGSAALLLAIVETPVLSHLFGCRPVGIPGLLIAAGTSVISGAVARRSPRKIPVLESLLADLINEHGTEGPSQAEQPLHLQVAG